MAKVMISVDDNLLARIDNYADNNYMSRSGLLTMAATNYLNQAEALIAVKDMSFCLRKIAETGSVDDETMAQLNDFERFSRLLMGK